MFKCALHFAIYLFRLFSEHLWRLQTIFQTFSKLAEGAWLFPEHWLRLTKIVDYFPNIFKACWRGPTFSWTLTKIDENRRLFSEHFRRLPKWPDFFPKWMKIDEKYRLFYERFLRDFQLIIYLVAYRFQKWCRHQLTLVPPIFIRWCRLNFSGSSSISCLKHLFWIHVMNFFSFCNTPPVSKYGT